MPIEPEVDVTAASELLQGFYGPGDKLEWFDQSTNQWLPVTVDAVWYEVDMGAQSPDSGRKVPQDELRIPLDQLFNLAFTIQANIQLTDLLSRANRHERSWVMRFLYFLGKKQSTSPHAWDLLFYAFWVMPYTFLFLGHGSVNVAVLWLAGNYIGQGVLTLIRTSLNELVKELNELTRDTQRQAIS